MGQPLELSTQTEQAESSGRTLVKVTVADELREQIISGQIEPGDVVVEGKWAEVLGVSQGSVREAINILAAEGFVQKQPGRRARVTDLSLEDVRHIYQVRGVLEGLAARLVTERRQDVAAMDASLAEMAQALERGDIRALVNSDLRFHLLLCQLSGNPFLLREARRLIVPLFAFVLMRVQATGQGVEPWKKTLATHERVVYIIRAGDPFVAQQFVERSTPELATVAFDVWGEPATNMDDIDEDS